MDSAELRRKSSANGADFWSRAWLAPGQEPSHSDSDLKLSGTNRCVFVLNFPRFETPQNHEFQGLAERSVVESKIQRRAANYRIYSSYFFHPSIEGLIEGVIMVPPCSVIIISWGERHSFDMCIIILFILNFYGSPLAN